MRFPWANTLLLALILVELASGFFGLVSGSPDEALFIMAHRAGGYAILALLFWKTANVLFSLRWSRPPPPRTASLALVAVLAATLGLGFAWSFAGPFVLAWFSGVSWHIYAGAAMVPILVWHSLYHTRGFPTSFWVERRAFLRLSALSIAGLAFWQVGETATVLSGLSGARRRFTGSYRATAASDGAFPVVSWLNDRAPVVDQSAWALTVGGAVDHDTVLRYTDLAISLELPSTIDCTGGWYSEQVWGGVPVAGILDAAGAATDARSVTFSSETGYYRRFSLAEARGYLLATHVGGRPLTPGHGFPARLVAPGKRGFEWVKWVRRIEVGRNPKWLQPPLPLR